MSVLHQYDTRNQGIDGPGNPLSLVLFQNGHVSQGLASVFNITLGIVSWWTSKESERYNRLIQLRVFAFCLNILHAYITGPIIYQNDDVPLMAPGNFFASRQDVNLCVEFQTFKAGGVAFNNMLHLTKGSYSHPMERRGCF